MPVKGDKGRSGSQAGKQPSTAQSGSHAPGKGNAAAKRYHNIGPGAPPQPSTGPQATVAAPQSGPPPDALMMVVARKDGKDVDRWNGPADWDWELPMRFTGTRKASRWTWSDPQAASMAVQSENRHDGGILIATWASRKGANQVEIILVQHPGTAALDAGEQGMGTSGQGTGAAELPESPMDSPAAAAALRGDMADEIGPETTIASGDPAAQVDAQGVENGGLGHVGSGSGAGRSGSEAMRGSGTADGDYGFADGSLDPSWIQPFGTEIDNQHGGRTPQLEGEQGGSAGGTPEGEGNLLGMGLWKGVINAPAGSAPIVNAAIIIADADITGASQRLLGKIVRRMAARAIRRELRHEMERAIKGRLRQVRKELAESPVFADLDKAGKNALFAEARDTIENAYYQQARDLFARQAEEYEALARQFAKQEGEIAAHTRKLASENADAYRQLESAAVHNGGLESDSAMRAIGPDDGIEQLGESAETAAMREKSNGRQAGAVGEAGQSVSDRHHVLPREHKKWFQERGFPGDDIDQFCIELDVASHQAAHGGGDWKLARQAWPEGEWNTALMNELKERERDIGRMLTRDDVLTIVRMRLVKADLADRPFVPYKASR